MNIDTLVENFYRKQAETEDLINEVMKLMLLDDGQKAPLMEGNKEKFSAARFFDSIFTPNLSEKIGEVDTETRKEFQRSMRQVKGKTLRDKISGVKLFMSGDDSMADDASKVLSYLTFLKCMASVFQDFSPSGSGFLLEGFLAGLLRGYQIVEITDEDGEDVKGLPIADYETGSGEPVSLKRLTGGEGATPIKGSLVNLTSHLLNNPRKEITYVIAAIWAAGEGEKIAFYEFKINAENFIDWVGQFITMDEEGLQQLQAFAQGSSAQMTEQKTSPDELAKLSTEHRDKIFKIQAALGIIPGTEEDRDAFDGGKLPLTIKTTLAPLRSRYTGKKGKLADQLPLLPAAVSEIGAAAAALVGKGSRRAVKEMSPDGTAQELINNLKAVNEKTLFVDYFNTAKILRKIFDDYQRKLAPAGKYYSAGPIVHKRMKDPAGTTKVGQLSSIPDELKAAFPKWMITEPAQIQALVDRSVTTQRRAKKDLKEAKATTKDRTQFSIAQARVIGNREYYIDTVAVDRKSLLDVTRKYNVVIKERLSPIFETLDRLMDRLQMFYSYNKLGAAEQASEQCEILKTNVDEQIEISKSME